MNKIALSILLLLLPNFLGLHAEEHSCPRIVSQAPYITKSLQWLGLEACIVGVSRYDVLDRPRTGGLLDPDTEVIALLHPDLLITSNWNSDESAAQLAAQDWRVLRLDGFNSMAEVEENLRRIGHAANIVDIEARVSHFHRQWQEAAHRIKGNGKRVLLLSSCSGTGYSFGQKRWLSDLFSTAGFVNVETVPLIRAIAPGAEIPTLNALIDQLRPELLFIFEREQSPQCALIKPQTPIHIISLDGDTFLNPAPVVLEGLAELTHHQQEWNR